MNRRPYDDPRWRQIRRDMLNRHWQCARCGEISSLEVDHIVPTSKGGEPFDESNLQVLCRHCNRQESAGTVPEEHEDYFDVDSQRLPNRDPMTILMA